MKNQEIAKIFYEIAYFLEMEGVQFKPFAYQKAGLTLESLERDVEEIYKKEGLEGLKKIPGVGESIALKIEEYLKTARIRYYEDYRKKYPINLEELMHIEGLGPKRLKILYDKLKIKNLEDLEKSAKAGKISPLPGFGEKTEKNILEAIEFAKRSKGRFLLGEILPRVKEVYEKLKSLKEVERIDMVGSIRRMKETIGDVDFLVISKNPASIMDFFVSLPGIIKVWGKGNTKSSVRLKEGFDMDIRVLPKDSYGAALQYFTGSKEHNIGLRKIAMEKGLKLSEYGLFKSARLIAGQTEEEIYQKLGMDWIPPELREDRGELELALKKRLPNLIELKDIKGDLHIHSKFNGGANTIEEIAEQAIRLGYAYIGIADHTKFLKIEHGLDEEQIHQRNKHIERLNERYKGRIKILKGCEANILPDGSIDLDDKCLKEQDFVIAGVHSRFKMTKQEMTERIIKAMRNPHVDIISHPTGRLIQKRDEYEINLEKILEVAKETKTILEINSYPERLDLNDVNIKRAKELGVKMVINTDAHHIDQLRFIEYGVYQARRGWAEKEDIINCWPLKEMLNFLKSP
ncbi:MAG: DNA polymerase/3'-5' exonuclease PolX [Candidatus Omnitrophica bacterium]|nr:DNA polymerase/3'-5' exonuclease PolX [Candidatus Omnitrophota bacterium]